MRFAPGCASALGDLLVPIELRETDPDADASESALAGADAARVADELKQQRERELAQINEALEEVLPEAFASVREAMVRALGKRHYDVQLMGGIVLHRGAIAEMRTGEGKTFVAPLAAFLNGLVGRGVHVVTVNDYLAKRDAQWIGAIFHRLGMSVGSIQHDAAFLFDPDIHATDERLRDLRPVSAARGVRGRRHVRHEQRVRLRLPARQPRRRPRAAARSAATSSPIVDEVDNILIDEARTPLIISGNAEESADKYLQFARLVPRLKAEEDYVVDEKFKQVAITEAGTDKMEGWLGVDNMFADDFSLARHLEQALKAAGPLPARPRLRRQGRRGDHRRRVHRPPDARAPMVGGPPPGGRGQGGRRRSATSSGRSPRSRSRTTSACTTSWPA